jgi:hypothetical protein
MPEHPYRRVQSDPVIREAEDILNRIVCLAAENELLLADLADISRCRAICSEVAGLVDRLDRIRAGLRATPARLQ